MRSYEQINSRTALENSTETFFLYRFLTRSRSSPQAMSDVYRQEQDWLKRRHDEEDGSFYQRREKETMRGELLGFTGEGSSSSVFPQVTVVFEGRSICQRIHLHKLHSYESLALALHRMFIDQDTAPSGTVAVSSVIPGHIVAYEDMENDLLLVGDLSWR